MPYVSPLYEHMTEPTPASIAEGEIVTCTVLGLAPGKGYFVDIGSKQPALLPAAEVCLLPNVTGSGSHSKVGQGWRQLETGDIYEGQIIGVSGDVHIMFSIVITYGKSKGIIGDGGVGV